MMDLLRKRLHRSGYGDPESQKRSGEWLWCRGSVSVI